MVNDLDEFARTHPELGRPRGRCALCVLREVDPVQYAFVKSGRERHNQRVIAEFVSTRIMRRVTRNMVRDHFFNEHDERR